jgi:AbiU2
MGEPPKISGARIWRRLTPGTGSTAPTIVHTVSKEPNLQNRRSETTQMTPLNELATALGDLVVDLNIKWRLYRELFQVDSHYALFGESGPGVWSVLRDSLLDDVFMTAARLLDPAASFGKENLSFERIISSLPQSDEQSRIKRDYQGIKSLYNRTLRDWRNWKLSHNSLKAITGASLLPDVSYGDVARLTDGVNQLARALGLMIRNIDQRHEPCISNQDWVWSLIEVLKSGIKPRQNRKTPKERMK